MVVRRRVVRLVGTSVGPCIRSYTNKVRDAGCESKVGLTCHLQMRTWRARTDDTVPELKMRQHPNGIHGVHRTIQGPQNLSNLIIK